MKSNNYYIYITTNTTNKVLYTGITSNLKKRIYEHKHKLTEGFTSKYNVNKLVYFELFNSPQEAIEREKQIKGGSRKKKLELISKVNSAFRDLYNEL